MSITSINSDQVANLIITGKEVAPSSKRGFALGDEITRQEDFGKATYMVRKFTPVGDEKYNVIFIMTLIY